MHLPAICSCSRTGAGSGEDSVLGSRRVRGVGQAAGGRHLRDAVRSRGRSAARDHGAGVGRAVERHRSEHCQAPEAVSAREARKPHKDWLGCILCLAGGSSSPYNSGSAGGPQQLAERSRDPAADAGGSDHATGQDTTAVAPVACGQKRHSQRTVERRSVAIVRAGTQRS